MGTGGTIGNNSSERPHISGDGRYVTFVSAASDLVAGDTNGAVDVFVHDLQAGTTERVSVASDGTQGNNASADPRITSDGRYMTFTSSASNLVTGDTNGQADIFVRDRVAGVTERVNVATNGTVGGVNGYGRPSISDDGRYVAFFTEAALDAGDDNLAPDMYVRDRLSGVTTWVSVRDGGLAASAYNGWISADGEHLVMTSDAALLPSDSNGAGDVYVADAS